MPKVLILTSEFPPQPGGIGNHAFHLAKGLQVNGYDVTVVSDQRSDNGEAEKGFDGQVSFRVVRIPRKAFIFISYFNRIRTAFSEGKNADIILSSGKFSLWMGALLSFFQKMKFVAVVHGSEIKLRNPFLRKLTAFSLKRYDTVIAVSEFTKSLVSHLNLKNISVIPNGFEIGKPEIQKINKDQMPVLITVGNVTERKGQHNVIKALPSLLKKFPDLKYQIVGIPTDKKKLEKLSLALGVENSVEFYGKVEEKVKKELLSKSDVFVMLSEKTKDGDVEGFGIAILEANALGVPAIGAKDCGIEDAINQGHSGKLIDTKSPQQFEKALTEILNNYQTYSNGAKDWSTGFTWDKILTQYLEVLGKVEEKT